MGKLMLHGGLARNKRKLKRDNVYTDEFVNTVKIWGLREGVVE